MKTKPARKKSSVAIVMGSDSDLPVMKEAAKALDSFGVPYEMKILSAHRTPDEMTAYAKAARGLGIRVFIAGAGGSAHLPGMIAANTELPVIGVPVPHPPMEGEDALWSIVQMPKGVPVATVAIGGAYNAGLLATQILAAGSNDAKLLDALLKQKEMLRKTVLKKEI